MRGSAKPKAGSLINNNKIDRSSTLRTKKN